MRARLVAWLPHLFPFFAVLAGLSLGVSVTAFFGESPTHVFMVLVKSALGSREGLGMTLFYSTILLFTGLSVSVAFRAGLFNVGAEGQLTMGALAAAATGILLPNIPKPLSWVLAAVAAFTAGALWGVIPGWLRARRGSHEVINTIMLNFVASGLASFITLNLLKNPDSQNPETRLISLNYVVSRFATFGGDAPVGFALPFALCVLVFVSFYLKNSVRGYELGVVGQSDDAARVAGISVGRVQVFAFALAGGLAGLVGVAEVLGHSHRYVMGFSADYGFMGVAVALLGRGSMSGLLGAAVLFGALQKGTSDLDLETERVTRELAWVLQSFVILAVSIEAGVALGWFKSVFRRFKKGSCV